FLAAVSDAQCKVFCQVLGFEDLLADPSLATNNERVERREYLLAQLRPRLAHRSAAELTELMENAGLPYAPIRKPEELLDDEHLLATGGLADIYLTDGPKAGELVKTTLLPMVMDGERLGVRNNPPHIGENTDVLLAELGYSDTDIAALRQEGVVA